MTNVVCDRSHPFNFGMIAPGNHLDLGQHRTMGTAGFGGSFAPIVQYEKWEIHPVFPHFSYFRLCQNLSPNLLAPLCGAALDSLRAAPPARYRSMVQKIGFWRVVRACHCDKVAHYFRGNLHGIPGPRTSYAVGALIERPAEKSLLSRFLSAKRFLLPDICCKIGTFPRALNERPYEVRRKAD